VLVVSEFSLFLDDSTSFGQTQEDSLNVGTLFHGDYTELILLVDPAQESLFGVVEDTSSFGPITVKATRLEETVALLE
jgi:hypothetical protein